MKPATGTAGKGSKSANHGPSRVPCIAAASNAAGLILGYVQTRMSGGTRANVGPSDPSCTRGAIASKHRAISARGADRARRAERFATGQTREIAVRRATSRQPSGVGPVTTAAGAR
jgi:hypothetical protein